MRTFDLICSSFPFGHSKTGWSSLKKSANSLANQREREGESRNSPSRLHMKEQISRSACIVWTHQVASSKLFRSISLDLSYWLLVLWVLWRCGLWNLECSSLSLFPAHIYFHLSKWILLFLVLDLPVKPYKPNMKIAKTWSSMKILARSFVKSWKTLPMESLSYFLHTAFCRTPKITSRLKRSWRSFTTAKTSTSKEKMLQTSLQL